MNPLAHSVTPTSASVKQHAREMLWLLGSFTVAIDNGYAEAGKTDTHTHTHTHTIAKQYLHYAKQLVQAGSMAGQQRRASLKRQCLNPALSNGGGLSR